MTTESSGGHVLAGSTAPSSIDSTWASALALGRLQDVMDAWLARGATFVPLPWMVPPRFLAMTRPPGKSGVDFLLGTEGLVASAEQAFLWLDEEGRLPASASGVYVGWTPCFREEPVYDALHQRAFVKAELYAPVPLGACAEETLATLRSTCLADFSRWAARAAPWLSPARQSDGSWDIELAGVEVGSYGVRPRPRGGFYVYGTALAEPRWSTALARCPSTCERNDGAD